MPQVFDKMKGWLLGLVELGLLLVALGIVLQILFGRTVGFITGDIVGNMILLIKALGDNGLGVLWLLEKCAEDMCRRAGTTGFGPGHQVGPELLPLPAS
jgi:hypothetical protein